MPLTHVILDKDGEKLTIKEARERLYRRGDSEWLTPELFEAMMATRQERDYVSTTSLTTKCLRQQALMRQVDYAEEVTAMWASFRGTMFHGQLEKHVVPPAIEEPRFFVTLDIDGEFLTLSGSPDLVDPVTGQLYDYKFTKENPRFDRPWPDHVAQVNVNRWLVDHAERMEWRGDTWLPDPADPQYFVNEATGERVLVRPHDWQALIVVYMDDKGPKKLTVQTSVDVPTVDGKGTKKARVPDIWDDEKAEAYVIDHYVEAHLALTIGEVPPVPVGWEAQSHILCQYCPVRKECALLEREGK